MNLGQHTGKSVAGGSLEGILTGHENLSFPLQFILPNTLIRGATTTSTETYGMGSQLSAPQTARSRK